MLTFLTNTIKLQNWYQIRTLTKINNNWCTIKEPLVNNHTFHEKTQNVRRKILQNFITPSKIQTPTTNNQDPKTKIPQKSNTHTQLLHFFHNWTMIDSTIQQTPHKQTLQATNQHNCKRNEARKSIYHQRRSLFLLNRIPHGQRLRWTHGILHDPLFENQNTERKIENFLRNNTTIEDLGLRFVNKKFLGDRKSVV